MEVKKSFLIIGAGAVGTNTALVLNKLGHKVSLVHEQYDIFAGSAANTAFIWHATGEEYCREGHQATGELCIAGHATQSLMFPMNFLSTNVCSPENPVKFYVSNQSTYDDAPDDSHVPVELFHKNMLHMKHYFTERIFLPTVDFFRQKYNLPETEAYELAEKELGCNPESFSQKLHLSESDLAKNVAAKYSAAGKGINMPHLYAYYKAAFRQSSVRQELNAHVKHVEKLDSGQYQARLSNGNVIIADSIILAAGIGNPELASKIPGPGSSIPGTYYFNTMVHVRLPEGGDTAQIIFTLQQQFGGAFTCVDATSRHYVVYKPDPGGSQREKHVYDETEQALPPLARWNQAMHDGLDLESAKQIVRRASETYPVLKHANILQAPLRPVFNVDSTDSPNGSDRRVRGMRIKQIAPNAFVTHGAKATNSLLTGITAAHLALQALGLPGLPTSAERGLGPENLDILQLSETVNFRDVKGVKTTDAIRYAFKNGLPTTMVRGGSPEFSWTAQISAEKKTANWRG